jgi:hypothetical protein
MLITLIKCITFFRSTISLTRPQISSIKSAMASLDAVLFFENLIMKTARFTPGRREKICKLYFIASVDMQKRRYGYV